MNSKEVLEKEVLQDVAISLNWNLHSSASENILSSLLAASLNNSDDFMIWFFKERCKIGMNDIGMNDRRNFKKFYAYTNDSIPYMFKCMSSKGKPISKVKPVPSRPDILILHDGYRDQWKTVCRYNKREKSGLNKAKKAAKKTPVIFIEVKHTDLSEKDYKKYKSLLDSLSGLVEKKTKSPTLSRYHKFIVISSHNKEALKRIIPNSIGSDKLWYELTKGTENKYRVKHITFEEIYDVIKNEQKNLGDGCYILELFKFYLALYLGKYEDEIFAEYWRRVIENNIYDLKWEIVDYIHQLTKNAFIKDTKKHNLREEDIKYLHTIELYKKKGNDYRIKFHTKERQNGYRKFELKLGQNTEPIEFDLKDIMQDSNIITENLKEVIKFIETEVLGQH